MIALGIYVLFALIRWPLEKAGKPGNRSPRPSQWLKMISTMGPTSFMVARPRQRSITTPGAGRTPSLRRTGVCIVLRLNVCEREASMCELLGMSAMSRPTSFSASPA